MPTRLERAHANTRRRISNESQRMIRRAWVASGSEGEFVDEAIAIARSARSAVVAEIDAFLASYLAMNGIPTDVRGLDPERYVRPVEPDEQWRRPHKHLRMKLAEEMPLPQALAFGGHMAESILATDLQLANRDASADWIGTEDTATGYRRTLGGDPCGLCIAAADQLYYRDDLMGIHVNCHCGVVPVSLERRYGLTDGQYQQVLDQTGGDTSREALSRVRLGQPQADAIPFSTAQHGELGPYLFQQGHSPPLLDAAA